MKNCPFCSKDKLKIEVKVANNRVFKGAEVFYRVTSSVRCNCCHSRGPTASLLVHNVDNSVTQYMEILAIQAWDNRT